MVNVGNAVLDGNITRLTVEARLLSGVCRLHHLHFTHIGLDIDLFLTRFQCLFGFVVIIVASFWLQWWKAELLSFIVLFSKTIAVLSGLGFGCVLLLVPRTSEICVFLSSHVSMLITVPCWLLTAFPAP